MSGVRMSEIAGYIEATATLRARFCALYGRERARLEHQLEPEWLAIKAGFGSLEVRGV